MAKLTQVLKLFFYINHLCKMVLNTSLYNYFKGNVPRIAIYSLFSIFSLHTILFAQADPWLKKIPLNTYCGDKTFWEQKQNAFVNNNKHIFWITTSGRGLKPILQPHSKSPVTFWGLQIAKFIVQFDESQKLQKVQINFWNKGDFRKKGNSFSYSRYNQVISNFLNHLNSSNIPIKHHKRKISGRIKEKVTRFNIDSTLFELSNQMMEYITLTLTPKVEQKKLNMVQKHIQSSKRIDPNKSKVEFRQKLALNVKKRTNGEIVVSGIPMINQGDKGYCVPATCARIMQYYNFDTNEHELAKVMGTSADGGTSLRAIKNSLKRLSSGLPIYAKPIKFSPGRVQKYIDRGYPLIWVIPGHCRLIFGYNPQKRYILYSDSWGNKGLENKMPYKKARQITTYLALLK